MPVSTSSRPSVRLPIVRSGALALLLSPVLAFAASIDTTGCDLLYVVTPRYDTTPRRLDINLSFPAEGRSSSVIRLMPSWAGVGDFASYTSGWAGTEASTTVEPLPEPFRFTVHHASEGRVTVHYQVRTALEDPNDGKIQQQDQLYRTQISHDSFQFFGYGALPAVESWSDGRKGRMCVTLRQPADAVGPLIAGDLQLGASAREGTVIQQGSHVLIRHAFYAGGPGWRVQERPQPNGLVRVAFRGPTMTDEALFADKTAALMQLHNRFWGDTHVPTQVVAVTPNFSTGNYGGTKVNQAAVLHVSQGFSVNDSSFESLVGHENLHQWLPHRLGEVKGTDQNSVVPGYWLSEGFTDYYTHRLLLAAGLWTPQRYASQMTQVLQGYWRSSARNAPASAIAPVFFSNKDAGRQMYARGEILAMRWDAALIAAGRAGGLDDVLRGLLLPADQPDTGGPATTRVTHAIGQALGRPSPDADVTAYVDLGQDLPLPATLAGPCFELGWADVPRWVPGFDVPGSLKAKAATGVVEGGPAWKAGLRDGMAMPGWSVYGGNTDKDIELRVQTDSGLQTLSFRPVDGSTQRLPRVTVNDDAPSQAACRAWVRAQPAS